MPTTRKPKATEAATPAKPKKAIILARISDDRNGEEKGVTDQVADGRQHARRLGWRVGPEASHVLVENDTSAFKRRKIRLPDGRVELRTVRPKFRRALELLASGQADGLIAVDLDRTARDPRDLEDLIDVVESKVPRIPVESASGSLKLANDADVTMARVLVAVANKSSRDTSRRVRRARERQATEGRFGGGARRYGHEQDGAVRADEAEILTKAAEALLSGVGLIGIVKDLNARGVPAPKAKRWTHSSLRDMLLQARLAGLMAWEGEVLEGVEACWEPILDRPTWEAVVAVLNSPERRTTPGPKPRHLLSHLARCGHDTHPDDDRPVMVKGWFGGYQRADGSAGPRLPAYRCIESGHLAVAHDPLDDYVTKVVIERLSRPDAAELLIARPDVDVSALATEANSLRARLANLGDLVESGDMTPVEYRQRKARLSEQLAGIEAEMTAAAGTSPLAGIAGRPDAGEVWADLDLATRRAVIDTLMDVVVLPAQKRGKGFDGDRVRIVWRLPA
jgi:DNA invertase Pin-like site-specific DNA recombinase